MGERWDRDRFMFERNRDQQSRADDDRFYMRGGRGGGRDHSADSRRERRFQRSYDEDDMVRDRRYYEDDIRPMPRRERSPDLGRRPPVMEMEREREREFVRRESPPRRRPGFLRRQSSLDTFDRPPHPIFHQREEYPPPARRGDFRAPPYTPIPLPKTKALPPPEFYRDEDFPAERVREREFVRSRRHRGRSRDSFRSRSHRSSSASSSTSSRSSSSSGGTTVRSEYPKKGKTRIPAKLVSRQALIDLGYPFYEEGSTIIVLKALGQENIDELLKVSEEYKKVEGAKKKPAALPPPPEKKPEAPPEKKAPAPIPAPAPAPPPAAPVAAPKAPAAPLAGTTEVKVTTTPAPPPPAAVTVHAPAPPPAAPPVVVAPPPPAAPVAAPPPPRPVMVPAPPPPGPVIITAPPPPESSVDEWVEETYYRDVSPSRSSTTTTTWDTHHHHHHGHRREKSAPIAIGPVALASRSRSRSRSGKEIRAEIRALERELAHRPKGGYERETVRAERLPDGQLVVYEEEVEDVAIHRKPPRIEKDKKGRMSISVPKYR